MLTDKHMCKSSDLLSDERIDEALRETDANIREFENSPQDYNSDYYRKQLRIERTIQQALQISRECKQNCNSAWQPIETAPKDGSDILVFESGFWHIVYWNKQLSWWDTVDCVESSDFNPTHWQPLPTAPTGDANPQQKEEIKNE